MTNYSEKHQQSGTQDDSRAVQINNRAIRDKALSFKARGLHHYLLAACPSGRFTVTELVKASDKDGKTAIVSALRELMERGYLTQKELKDERGRFAGVSYQVFQQPVTRNQDDRQPEGAY